MYNFWVPRYPEEAPRPPANLPDWAGKLDISPFLADLLWKRGLHTLEDMELFLNPGLRHLVPPESVPGLEEAAEILAGAALSGKKLVVWGDYDVDGITATALVAEFFRWHGFEILTHIPDRMHAGYGLNLPDLRDLAARGAELVLTVDCGIGDYAEIRAAREMGLRIIVSDHHLPSFPLPEAEAVCSPTIADCPCPHLSGVGTAFFLMAGVGRILEESGRPRMDIRRLLDLVALGTLADVSNLSGQNRILVKNGLLLISEARRPGLAALKSLCKYAPDERLGSWDVVFSLCPRINAAGRMGKSEVALRLLLSGDRDEAARLAAELDSLNALRRKEEDSIQAEALEQAQTQADRGRMGLVLYRPHWHMGVIGIVASRMVEKFNLPAIILCDHGEKLKGSGRSLEGFDLHAALESCSEQLLGFGGHRMAAGLSLSPDKLEDFSRAFDAAVKNSLGDFSRRAPVKIDGELGLAESTSHITLKELEIMQPFGEGNAEPVFASPPLRIRNIRPLQGNYVLDVCDERSGLTVKAKIWRSRNPLSPRSRDRKLRLAYSPRLDRYNGASSVELRVQDWFLLD
ncbi:MAG: single-stranded-DNA-specific exonuclease RecJ [Deltaproteobacteria bacterium]|jgi:single-stranded-DNA-specific exonuclease|nr:single-stranded-DNA-specific exonuclease RecJ [Deltaproteobacteria bacterium]